MLKPTHVKIITAVCLVFALAVAAFGARAQETKPGYTNDLTVEQALNVAGGLAQLTSYDSTDKEGKPTKVFYKLSSDLRILIAVNIDVGRSVQTRFQTAQNDLVMQLSGGTGKVPDEKTGQFNVEIGKMMQAKALAGFYRIKAADLKLDENPIPGPVLSLIVPILDR